MSESSSTDNPDANQDWSPDQFTQSLGKTAFAFRGYNVTNLERTPDLLACENYRPILEENLRQASLVASQTTGKSVDLVSRVEHGRETSLATYHEAVAMILAVELTQVELLGKFFSIPWGQVKLSYGFSLGEIGALIAGGVFQLADAAKIPISLAEDAANLSLGVVLGVLFSRGRPLELDKVHWLCGDITSGGGGTIGVSAYLAPNSVLVIGQNGTLDEFKERLGELSTERLHLRRNENQWPPLHTPIVWQHHIPDRAARLLENTPFEFSPTTPPIFSLATGQLYNQYNVRQSLRCWVDHPQQLWNAVDRTLNEGIETVVHVGPRPNIIPATFKRVSGNVESQTKGRIGLRALSGIIKRPWLAGILPKSANLLRAPQIRHVILEDWLITHHAKLK